MGAAPHGRRLGADAALMARRRWYGELAARCAAWYGAAARGGGGGGFPWRRGHGVEAASGKDATAREKAGGEKGKRV